MSCTHAMSCLDVQYYMPCDGYPDAYKADKGERKGSDLQAKLGLGEQAASGGLPGLCVKQQADVCMQHPGQPSSNQLGCIGAAHTLLLQACKQAGGVEVGHTDGLCSCCVATNTQATPATGAKTGSIALWFTKTNFGAGMWRRCTSNAAWLWHRIIYSQTATCLSLPAP